MGTSEGQRKVLSIVLGVCLLVLLAGLTAMNAFNAGVPSPSSTDQVFVFTGLSAVAFLLFVAVLVLLVRNVLKLYADQRSRVLGTRLRTRMLWGAMLVSLLPIAFMAAFSYGLMNRAVDRWFSQPVTEMRDDSNRMALELARYTTANARGEADAIAQSLPILGPAARAGAKDSRVRQAAIDRVLGQHEVTLQGGFVVVYHDGHALAAFHMPASQGQTAEVKSWLPEHAGGGEEDGVERGPATAQEEERALSDPTDTAILTAAQRTDQPIYSIGANDYALGIAGMKQGGVVVVGMPLPSGMSATMTRLRTAADTYWALFKQRRQIRNAYLGLLLMMTCLALFAASWLALHMSKQVTKPVEALADAMEAIAAGDYGHRVQESATEELGELVRSFNQMASDLEGSRAQVEQSTVQLSAANSALEARRSELETMLETIPNGVATLDRERRVVLANRGLIEMMDPGGQKAFIGSPVETLFPAEMMEGLDRLIRRSHRMGTASGEMEMTQHGTRGGVLHLLATIALLENGIGTERRTMGYVLVLENATELLRAQKQSAWKEVARRVAHEIKNPLTPISLSAEQIRRHIDRLGLALEQHGNLAADANGTSSVAVIRRCSEVISGSVESMRSLVDQFAALAEFPTAQPRPADLNAIVENAFALFAGRLQSMRLVKKMARELPLVMADPEAMKRALGNLIDNAAEAMQQSLLRELCVETALAPNGMVELTISDTGPGVTDEMRERLFLPYFSTKQRGTGLGLAIAAKIIQEHQGTIRVEKNEPIGARFIVELPPALGVDGSEPEPAADVAGITVGTVGSGA